MKGHQKRHRFVYVLFNFLWQLWMIMMMVAFKTRIENGLT